MKYKFLKVGLLLTFVINMAYLQIFTQNNYAKYISLAFHIKQYTFSFLHWGERYF
jgi:hypothetical protein